MRKERTTISIDSEILGRIDALCSVRGESRSSMIERVMIYALEDYEEHLKALENPLTQRIVRAVTGSPKVLGVLVKALGQSMSAEEIAALRDRNLTDADVAEQRRKEKKAAKRKKR